MLKIKAQVNVDRDDGQRKHTFIHYLHQMVIERIGCSSNETGSVMQLQEGRGVGCLSLGSESALTDASVASREQPRPVWFGSGSPQQR